MAMLGPGMLMLGAPVALSAGLNARSRTPECKLALAAVWISGLEVAGLVLLALLLVTFAV